MRFFADLHIHSRFSRATSKSLDLSALYAWAQKKGIYLIGTGDITHPVWFEEIVEQLVPAEDGLFRLRDDLARQADALVPKACRSEVRFTLQGEISSIYKHDGAVRKVHNVVFSPGLEEARRFLSALDKIGNIRSDGRPILGLSSRNVLETLLESSPKSKLVPAHVWTPWFSLLGSKSGYDSLEACFGDLSEEVTAIETGLSSDPPMNWRISALDRFALISNSDAHSPQNLGREVNEFDLEPCYDSVFGSLRPGDPRFLGTIEFHPDHGKYHLDGHRKCNLRLSPEQTRELGGRCPECGGKITVGVLSRVEDLADRVHGEKPETARAFENLVPLAEVLAECLGVGKASKKVEAAYELLLEKLGPEFFVLRNAPLEEIEKISGPVAAEGVRRLRKGEIFVEGGYDGEFGVVKIFDPSERKELTRQSSLFSTPAKKTAPRKPTAVEPACTAPEKTKNSKPRASKKLSKRPGANAKSDEDGEAEPRGNSLNPQQAEAVNFPPGPLIIIAGPGTGKTKTLTSRIAHKVAAGQTPPERIAAITFTNRAAEELKTRLAQLLGNEAANRITVCTLHRLALTLLRAHADAAGWSKDFAILDEDERIALAKSVFFLSAKEASTALNEISAVRRECGSIRVSGPPPSEQAAAFEEALKAENVLGLDDLIPLATRVLETDPQAREQWRAKFAHIAVDEFQDLDPEQYRLISTMAPPGSDVTIIGDPDQSIYGFRGASPGLFKLFMQANPSARTINLLKNYRSTSTILSASANVISADGNATRESLTAFCEEGPRIVTASLPTDRAEAEFVVSEIERTIGGSSNFSINTNRASGMEDEWATFGDVCVLYRLKAQRPAIEEAFQRSGIPYRTVGEEPEQLRGKGKEILRRLKKSGRESSAPDALGEILKEMEIDPDSSLASAWRASAITAKSAGELADAVMLRSPDDDHDPRAEKVALMTMHAAKGLEFPIVFLVGCEDGILPHVRSEEPTEEEIAEERRLLYVGMTRAKKQLYISHAKQRLVYGKITAQQPSRFLAAIEKALLEASKNRPSKKKEQKQQSRQLSLF